MSIAARGLHVDRTRRRAPRALAALRFAALLYLFVAVLLLLAAALPALAGMRPLAVVSGSMVPALPRGAVVVVERAEPDGYYDTPSIVTYRDPARGTLVTHRVVGTRAGRSGVAYTTKGDANAVADSDPVPHRAVLGAVRLVVPFAGLPAAWLHAGEYPALAAAAAATLLAVVTVALRRRG